MPQDQTSQFNNLTIRMKKKQHWRAANELILRALIFYLSFSSSFNIFFLPGRLLWNSQAKYIIFEMDFFFVHSTSFLKHAPYRRSVKIEKYEIKKSNDKQCVFIRLTEPKWVSDEEKWNWANIRVVYAIRIAINHFNWLRFAQLVTAFAPHSESHFWSKMTLNNHNPCCSMLPVHIVCVRAKYTQYKKQKTDKRL